MTTVKELKNILNAYPDDTPVFIASDEEWNTLYKDVESNTFTVPHTKVNSVVLYGLDGSNA